MMTGTNVGSMISGPLKMTLGYADKLIQSIPADQFAAMPRADLNSPAFCIGHLAIYAPMVAGMIGSAEGIETPAHYQDLFKNGAPCIATPGHYPSKAELIGHFVGGWSKVAELLATVDDARLSQPNPMEQMIERLPTVGGMVSFMALAHNMMHLGQISAWRRVMGLGSAM